MTTDQYRCLEELMCGPQKYVAEWIDSLIAQEREDCAQIAEGAFENKEMGKLVGFDIDEMNVAIAKTIRSRGEKT